MQGIAHLPFFRVIAALLAVALCWPMAGCRSTSRSAQATLVSAEAPASFSDETNRELIRQTQEILAMRDRDYLVGPDDVLEISIFEWEMREETKTLQFRVSESGMVSLPALGSLAVAEKTVQEIQSTIEKELSTRNILQNPRVGVSVREFRSRRIAVVGEVNAPGVYAIHQNVTTFADVLTLAGGPTAAAGQIAYVLRFQRANSAPLRIVVDLQELLDRGSFELNAALKGGDVIYVPRAPLVFVYGTVRQPGAFALNRSMRVLEAIALAGGFAERADKRRCTLTRRTEGSGQVLIPLDIAGIERGTVPNPYLRDGDVVAVPISLSEVALVKLWEAFRGIFTFTYQLNPNN